jgi:hypothetical protein
MLLLLLLLLVACVAPSTTVATSMPSQIVLLGNGEPELALAAKELRRYVYATSSAFPAIIHRGTVSAESSADVGAVRSDVLVVGTAASLAAFGGLEDAEDIVERIRIAGSDAHGRVCHSSGATVLVGATPLAVLYAAYDWASSDLGVYFAIDGDRIPRRGVASRVAAANCTEMLSQPQFGRRGTVP